MKRMPTSERAKQFMPFAALKGLPEALAEMEKIKVDKMELSDDMAKELDRKFRCIESGKRVEIVYFHNDEYIKVAGIISEIDMFFRFLKITDKQIYFDDVLDIKF